MRTKKEEPIKLNPEQAAGLSMVRSGHNVFFTGPAGTGKSVLLRALREEYEDLQVAASTGIAALGVGGCTLHSWAGFGISDHETAAMVAKKHNERRNSIWKSIVESERLAIDEISMLSADLLDKLDLMLKIVRKRDRPFGGLQLILFGDFCLKAGTKIVMADGTLRCIEDVSVGDQVMGPDSKPRNVVREFAGTANLYDVKQANGDTYTVTGNHQIAMRRRGACRDGLWARFPATPDAVTITAPELMKKSGKFLECYGGYKAGCLKLPERSVKLDPYFFGVWLGDGEKTATRITSNDPEILEYCQEFSASWGLQCTTRLERESSTCLRINITSGRRGNLALNPVKEILREYGVYGNKHIPEDYLLNSERNRLKLLAGLLDTDGCWSGNRFIYCSTLDRLAAQVKQLCDHLGFRAMLRRNSADNAWEVSIGGDTWRIPTKIKRKQSALRSLGRCRLNSTLKVAEAGVGQFAGIETDGDHLFLLADGTVTHNCQLPPVSKDGRAVSFAFQARSWHDADIKVHVLIKIMRQADLEFANTLSRIRLGDCGEEVRRVIRPRIGALDPKPEIPPVIIVTHNADADKINGEKLAAINEKELKWEARDDGISEMHLQTLDKNCIAPKNLVLKIGAAVMLIKNISTDEGLVNGSLGTVVGVTDAKLWGGMRPIVKFTNGITRELERQEWQTTRGAKVLATRSQVPLRLAWAITAHKSQGMTIEKIKVHLKRCFADGQAYVALSRARSIDGLFIEDINGTRPFRANEVALGFYRQHTPSLEAVA